MKTVDTVALLFVVQNSTYKYRVTFTDASVLDLFFTVTDKDLLEFTYKGKQYTATDNVNNQGILADIIEHILEVVEGIVASEDELPALT